jgi:Zn-dependent M28 family amino/carboxypeptidase
MPRALACLIALALASPAESASFSSEQIRTAESLRDAALKGTQAYDAVEDLTTRIGPRLAGTTADHRAVDWMESRLRAAGFDRVWRQEVTFPYWLREREHAEIVGETPQPLVITALGGSIGTGETPLESEVVAFPDLAALRAAPAGSLDGKIAFISYRMGKARDGAGYGPAVGARTEGAVAAARAGASALLIRSIGSSPNRFAHTGIMRYAADVPRIPAAALSAPDAEQIERLLTKGLSVKVKLDIAAGEQGIGRSWNVVGEITGRELPDEVVAIGGHLDSWDTGTGALDDGAGIAITFEAARRIAELPERPRRSIRFIAWASEENGLMGARQYAASVGSDWANHQVAAESDFGAGRIYALRAGVSPEAWQAIEAIGEVLEPLGIVTEADKGGPGPDVGPLAGLGVPWAQLAQDGIDYFDFHHTPNDTLDKIDAKALDQQVAAYAAFAYLAAESEIDFGRAPSRQANN